MVTKKTELKGEAIRLDKFLASENTALSRGDVQRLISEGVVKVNGEIVRLNKYILRKGDKTEIKYETPKLQPDKTVKLVKIFEDRDVLILDKPAGLLVHPVASQKRQTLAGGLLAAVKGIGEVGEGKFRPGIVHRLDVDTSGLMIVAKNNKAYKYLKELFQLRDIEKRYLALVHGEILQKHGFFNLPIGRKTGQSKFRAGFGREAKTEYWRRCLYTLLPSPAKRGRVPGSFPARAGQEGTQELGQERDSELDIYTLVEVQLHTGRTHQIRVHFSSAGHPVAGDNLYGRRFKKTDSKIFSRQFLHSYYLKLKLPNGKIKKIEIGLSQDLKKILKQLKLYSSSESVRLG